MAPLFLWRCLDHYLQAEGRFGFVMSGRALISSAADKFPQALMAEAGVTSITNLSHTPMEGSTLRGAVAGVLLTYLRDTRRYLAGDESGDALFIGWRRKGIGKKNFDLRVLRARCGISDEAMPFA